MSSLAPPRSFGSPTAGTTGHIGHFTAPTGEARWHVIRPGSFGDFGFETEVTARGYRFLFSSDDMAVETAKRALGCVILALMPEEGLDNALSELTGTCEFYLEDRDLRDVMPLTLVSTGVGVGESENE